MQAITGSFILQESKFVSPSRHHHIARMYTNSCFLIYSLSPRPEMKYKIDSKQYPFLPTSFKSASQKAPRILCMVKLCTFDQGEFDIFLLHGAIPFISWYQGSVCIFYFRFAIRMQVLFAQLYRTEKSSVNQFKCTKFVIKCSTHHKRVRNELGFKTNI